MVPEKPKQVNMLLLILWGIALPFLTGVSIHYAIGKEMVSRLDELAWFGSIISFLIATSLLGKTTQLIGWVGLQITSGVRFSVLLFNPVNGSELNVYWCSGALGVWVLILIINGHSHSQDSDEWQITIATIISIFVANVFRVILML